ncbi:MULTISPECIES: glycosyltransferase family 4 protein [unclassified Sphingobium]|nr:MULTISPECIES: glycosyltransferase family 1 protein [unclassified Sphingobium]
MSVLYQIDAGTGIQRVVRNIWDELRRMDRPGLAAIAVAASNGSPFHHIDDDFVERPKTAGSGGELAPYRPQPGDLFLALDFSPAILPRHHRAIANWKRVGVTVHVLVYDLLPVTNPEWFTKRGARNFRRWLSFVRLHADHAICISATVAQELRDLLPERGLKRFFQNDRPIKIDVVRLATVFEASGVQAVMPSVLQGVPARHPIILMVGTVEPRKGYDLALDIIDADWTGGVAPIFVIAGKKGWRTEALQQQIRLHPQSGRSLFWIEDASDEHLAWLYRFSTAFLSTSRAEGFGLPLAEAMSYGLPVVAPDLPVFREFSPEGILFYNVGQAVEAVAHLRRSIMMPRSARRSTSTSVGWGEVTQSLLDSVSGAARDRL